jgi:hydroxyacylglutathione hydrolase
MVSIQHFTFNEFQENTYILYDETKECIIVDPGCYAPREQQLLSQFIADNGLKPMKLVNTHCHIDHVLGNTFVAETFNIPLYLHEGELLTYNDTLRWTALFGIPPLVIPQNKVFINETDMLTFGNSNLSIAFTPGHSKASLTFYHPEKKFAIVGDVLFYESIGRTDLPGGNFDTLMQSIKNILMSWPDETIIYSGHGQPTTIGHEKKFNPFIKQ